MPDLDRLRETADGASRLRNDHGQDDADRGYPLEFGKIREGIGQSTDTSTLLLFCQSQFGGEGNFVA